MTEDEMLKVLEGIGIQRWNDEWLHRRGNYLTVITPEQAGKLLRLNSNNRRPRPRKIEQYKRDMINLRWDPDASDIKISRAHGATPDLFELLDGQNRLMACQAAGVPFPTLVRTGLELEAKHKVDSGTARTNADVLKMRGITSFASATAAAVGLRVRYLERYELFNRERGFGRDQLILTHDEVLAYLADHPRVTEFAGPADRVRAGVTPSIPTSVWLAALSWGAEIDVDLAHQIADRMVAGEFGATGDPLQALLAYAARRPGRPTLGSPGLRGRALQEEALMALIKVWNAMRTGTDIQRLKINRNERLDIPR